MSKAPDHGAFLGLLRDVWYSAADYLRLPPTRIAFLKQPIAAPTIPKPTGTTTIGFDVAKVTALLSSPQAKVITVLKVSKYHSPFVDLLSLVSMTFTVWTPPNLL